MMIADDSDEFTIPVLPPRSSLYHLAPVGVGTPDVESITGYIARLAKAHCVTVFILFKYMVLPIQRFSSVFGQYGGILTRYASPLNGIGLGAERAVSAFEMLTMRSDLRRLTLLPWGASLSPVSLFKKERVWCPFCYEEWRTTDQIIYEPLMWTIKSVEVCVRHRIGFRSACPHCSRTQWWLTNRSRPGHCSTCGGWLGEGRIEADHRTDESDEWKYKVWAADNIGNLLCAGACLTTAPTKDTTIKSIARCVELGAEGDINAFAIRVGVPSKHVRHWLRGRPPQLSTIMRMCYRVNVGVVDFLTGSIHNKESIRQSNIPARKRLAVGKPRVLNMGPFWKAIGEYLDALLRSQKRPPSVVEIARERKVIGGSLYTYFPEQCRDITLRRREDKIKGEERLLKAALRRRLPQTLEEVSKSMGFASPSPLSKRHSELCKAIADRSEAYKNAQRMERNESRLAEVRKVAMMLHTQGVYPSFPKVAAGLSMPSLMALEDMRNVLREVQKELGYRE